jgi:copper chaperone
MELTLPTMTCGHCVRTVTQTLQELDPQATITIDLPSHRVQVVSVESDEAVRAALEEAGYTAA